MRKPTTAGLSIRHAAMAVAGAVAGSRMLPGSAWVWWPLARDRRDFAGLHRGALAERRGGAVLLLASRAAWFVLGGDPNWPKFRQFSPTKIPIRTLFDRYCHIDMLRWITFMVPIRLWVRYLAFAVLSQPRFVHWFSRAGRPDRRRPRRRQGRHRPGRSAGHDSRGIARPAGCAHDALRPGRRLSIHRACRRRLYRHQFEFDGFQTVTSTVRVGVGSIERLDVTLRAGRGHRNRHRHCGGAVAADTPRRRLNFRTPRSRRCRPAARRRSSPSSRPASPTTRRTSTRSRSPARSPTTTCSCSTASTSATTCSRVPTTCSSRKRSRKRRS